MCKETPETKEEDDSATNLPNPRNPRINFAPLHMNKFPALLLMPVAK